jgi:TRAP-type C4-dicarboxylate transport system permease small subunit
MILKILLTAAVILGALLVLRRRTQRRMAPVVSSLPPPAVPTKRRLPWLVASSLLTLMIIGAGYYFAHQWWDAYRLVSVQVINSNTGAVVSYQAYKGDIDRENGSFQTIDGKVVTLAAVERLELGTK